MKKPRNLIGGQLQKIRHKKGISQMELSAIGQRKGWDISRNIIAKIESGSRCVSDFELVLLCEILGVSMTEMLPNPKVWVVKKKHFIHRSE